MSLFSLMDLVKKKPDKAKSGSVAFTDSNLLTIGKAGEKLSQVFGKVVDGQSVHYASLGDWSTHDLFSFCLNKPDQPEFISLPGRSRNMLSGNCTVSLNMD